MYVCGVSSGLSWLATKTEGSAGGVRTAVAGGGGVPVGMVVAEGWIAARAVSKACVKTAFTSAVGDDTEGAHAVTVKISRSAFNIREKEKGWYLDLFMGLMIAEEARH